MFIFYNRIIKIITAYVFSNTIVQSNHTADKERRSLRYCTIFFQQKNQCKQLGKNVYKFEKLVVFVGKKQETFLDAQSVKIIIAEVQANQLKSPC